MMKILIYRPVKASALRAMAALFFAALMLVAGCTATNNGVVRRPVQRPVLGGALNKTTAMQKQVEQKYYIEIGVAGIESAATERHSRDITGGSVFDDTTFSKLKRDVYLKPGNWKGHYNMGLFLASRGKFEKAEKSLHKAMENKGSPLLIYNALGTLYESMGNKEKALDFFKSALGVRKSPLTMMNIANTYMRTGQLEKSEKYYRMADKTDISGDPVFNYNMTLLLYKTEQYAEALERIDRTIKGGREDYLVRYTKASVLVKLNRYEEALVIFGQLKGQRPGDARLYKNMGVIYELYTGDMARALQNYVGYIGIIGEENAGDVSLWADVVRARISRQGGSATGQGSGAGQGSSAPAQGGAQ